MSADPFERLRYLKRLGKESYQGGAWVHWSMTIKNRRVGWLDDMMHLEIRQALLHCLARYRLICPVYCLMPDHAHFLWCGLSAGSDQLRACSLFRRAWNEVLKAHGYELQKQAYDQVLDYSKANRTAFEDVCAYILSNPVRAGLAASSSDWQFTGSLAAGYPMLSPRDENFWQRYWTIHYQEADDRLLEWMDRM